MKESESGFWFVVKNYPGIVREGLRLTTDGPHAPELRIDPEGARKRETHARSRRPMPIAIVPEVRDSAPAACVTIHLQWLDTSYEPVWRDTAIEVDPATRRLRAIEGWLLGRRHEGSGAIGVFIFASPALAVLSPYILARNAVWRARERKEGMSRHAIVLMERLTGQLEPETEALLREALRNEWTHHRKMTRRVTFEEAKAALTECELVESRFGRPDRRPHGVVRTWRDADGDVVAHSESEDGSPNPLVVKVLGSAFEGDEAERLSGVYLHRREDAEDED